MELYLWIASLLFYTGTISANRPNNYHVFNRKFIVTGSNNTVDQNAIENNENIFGSSCGIGGSCDYHGKHRGPTEVFNAVDGCNKCTCSTLGAICTTKTCGGKRHTEHEQRRTERFIVEGNGNTVDKNNITDNENTFGDSCGTTSCTYNGHKHGPREVFTAKDGCNKCTCSSLGPACTQTVCSGKRRTDRRFIVEGNGNHVDNNIIKDNENVYNNDSSSIGSSGGSSNGTSGGGSGSSGGTNWAASCDYNGQHHKPGETFPAGDGCNQCTCSPLGPACTTHFCSGKRSAYQRFIVTGSGNTVDGNTITNNENVYNNDSSSSSGGSSSGTSGGSNPAGGNCYYDGKHHNPGDVWVATDGCNKCTCSPLGAACTTHVCSGKKRQSDKRFIVDGDNNEVKGNQISNNENVYNNDTSTGSTSGGTSGGSSSGTSGGSSGGNQWHAPCDYNGQHHNPGETFPDVDGCNKCTCSPLGPACTTHFCSGKRSLGSMLRRFIVDGDNNVVDHNTIENNENVYQSGSGQTTQSSASTGSSGGSSSGGNCYYDGKHHNPGDVWVATDGCNKCTCSPLGAACTTHVCSGKKRQSGSLFNFILDGDNNVVENKIIEINKYVYQSEFGQSSQVTVKSEASSSISSGLLSRRFIVDGDNNVVDNNIIENNENKYGDGSGASSPSSGSGSGITTASPATCPGCVAPGSVHICKYNGHTYQNGNTFSALDKCNICTCNQGNVQCTSNPCATAISVTASCVDQHHDPTYCAQSSICNNPKDRVYNCQKTCGEHQRRFIVEGSNIIYDNHIVDNGHDVNLKVNVVKNTAGCTMVDGHYGLAQGFLDSDKCTQWSCTSTGIVFNSRQCPNHKPSQTDAIRCYYNGQQYDYGMTFMHADGCNQCVCNKNAIECTSLNQCTSSTGGCHTSYGAKYSYGQHFPKNDGCNICTCALAGIECTSNTCTQTHPITTQKPTIETSGPVSSNDCIVNNRRVPDGQKFYAKDGCNICECFAGYVECGYDKECGTTALPPVTAPHTTCTISGRVYSEGDVIPFYRCYHCVCHNGQRSCQSICGVRK